MTDASRVRKLASRIIDRRGFRASVSGEALMVVAHALRVYADTLERPPTPDSALNANFVVLVEGKNGTTEEVLAHASNGDVADAAFSAACRARPDRHIVLKQGTRLIRERDLKE